MSKGFTLIEMVLILLIISMLGFGIGIQRYDRIKLKWNMMKIENYLIYKKREALLLKEEKEITIYKNTISDGTTSITLDSPMYCESYVLNFNERGNVNMGGSFTCSYGLYEATIVINLGSGNIYVS